VLRGKGPRKRHSPWEILYKDLFSVGEEPNLHQKSVRAYKEFLRGQGGGRSIRKVFKKEGNSQQLRKYGDLQGLLEAYSRDPC